MEEKVRAAIIEELKRQAAADEKLSIRETDDKVTINGPVTLTPSSW